MDILKLREEYLKNNKKNQIKKEEIIEEMEKIEENFEKSIVNSNNDLNTNLNSYSESNNENINELFEILSNKINAIEIIDDSLVDEIFKRLKFIRYNHNKKITDWYDEKYNNDLNEFKQNNIHFNNLMKNYELNSFVLIENN